MVALDRARPLDAPTPATARAVGSREFTLPDIAVAPSTTGARTRLALTYYTLDSADCTETNCLLDLYVVTSKTAGVALDEAAEDQTRGACG